MQSKFFGILIALTCSLASTAHAANWTWQLPDARYKQLNQFERAQYDKAAALITAGNFAAAAPEFEKFKVQFQESPALSYAIFMRGYSLHQAKSRNTAVKVYQEVLDYFGDQVDDATAALYWMGVAHLDNGDTLKGLQCMKTLVDDPRYQKHALAAGALRRLADNHWNNKEYELAAKYYRQTIKDFGSTNEEERNVAVSGLATYNLTITREFASYESALIWDDATQKEEPNHRRWMAESLYQRAWQIWGAGAAFDRKKTITEKEVAEERKAFYDYFKTTKPWYDKANDPFGFYDHSIGVQVYYVKDVAERDRLVEEAVALAKTAQQKDKLAGDPILSRVCDILRDGRVYDRARYCVGLMADRTNAAYKEYEILAHEGKWEPAVAQLETLENGTPDTTWKSRAMWERARVYREVLNQQEKAIKLYQQSNNPPENLWMIQECYKRMNKLDQALTQLTEIENSFPPQASRAAWQKASYLNEAGDQKKAIAAAKRILKLYPKSGESSNAHQLLEKFGIATGGGLTDDQ